MKLRLFVLLLLAFSLDLRATDPSPTPILSAVDFTPDSTANLILRTETAGREYVRVVPFDTALLPAPAQAGIAAGLTWLGAQLGEGYTWSRIALRRVPNGIPAVLDDSDPPVVITPAQDRIVAAVYGSHPELGQSVIPQGELSLPDPLRVGILAIWAQVESLAQAGSLPLPEPTPPVE